VKQESIRCLANELSACEARHRKQLERAEEEYSHNLAKFRDLIDSKTQEVGRGCLCCLTLLCSNNTDCSIISKLRTIVTLLHHRQVPAVQPYCSTTADTCQKLTMPLLMQLGAHSGVVVEALCYMPEGHGFETRRGD
jgi:hypothetical protein